MAELAARELGSLALNDALDLCVLIAEQQPERFERAAVRWHGRLELARVAARPRVDAEGRDAEVVPDWPPGTAAVADLVDLVKLRDRVTTHKTPFTSSSLAVPECCTENVGPGLRVTRMRERAGMTPEPKSNHGEAERTTNRSVARHSARASHAVQAPR